MRIGAKASFGATSTSGKEGGKTEVPGSSKSKEKIENARKIIFMVFFGENMDYIRDP